MRDLFSTFCFGTRSCGRPLNATISELSIRTYPGSDSEVSINSAPALRYWSSAINNEAEFITVFSDLCTISTYSVGLLGPYIVLKTPTGPIPMRFIAGIPTLRRKSPTSLFFEPALR